MMAVLLAITVGGVCLGAAVIARHRAQAAADLAALAAAGDLADGADAACAQASAVARAMNAAVRNARWTNSMSSSPSMCRWRWADRSWAGARRRPGGPG